MNGDIDAVDYKNIKTEKITGLEARLSECLAQKKRREPIEPLVNKTLANLTKLIDIYNTSENEVKRELIGSMYPQKFTYEDCSIEPLRQANCILILN